MRSLKQGEWMRLINFPPKNWDVLSLGCRRDEIRIKQIVPCAQEIFAILGDSPDDCFPVIALALIEYPLGTDVVGLILTDLGVEIAEIDFLDCFRGFEHRPVKGS
jgi:hypothetical protein